MKRIVSAAVLCAVAVGTTLVAISTPAYAAQCSSQVVTVVVQFPDGHTEIGCTMGDPSDGLAALTSAGFPHTFVPNQPGAVCTIKGLPSSGGCWSPPDTWSYWRADAGGSWVASDRGAGSTNPAPGTVEGWRFGTNAAPDTDPPTASTPAPTKAPSAKPTKKPSVQSSTPQVTATATGTATASPSASASAPATEASSDLPPTDLPSQPSAGPTVVSAALAPEDDSSGKSWIWGLVLLGVLAAVGGGTVLARRRA